MIYDYRGKRYTLTRRRNGGQYSGPCPWSGGTDRFTVEPQSKRWFCRECSSSCEHGKANGSGYRYGRMDDNSSSAIYVKDDHKMKYDFLDYARKCAANLNQEGFDYLESRGITHATISHFSIGSLGKFVTIPLMFKSKIDDGLRCLAVKRRWLPQYRPPKAQAYLSVKGSHPSGIFNFDVLRKSDEFGIVANSLFDVMLLHQMGFQTIGPFVGEADWKEKWSQYIKWETIVNIGDFDTERRRGRTNELYRPGTEYMLRRAVKLGLAPNVKRIINVYPPGGQQDVNAAWLHKENISKWIASLL